MNASWGSFQGCFDLEPYYRKDGEKAFRLEVVIFIKRGQAYFIEEHFVEPSNLLFFFVYHSTTCSRQIREDSEELPLGEI